MPSADGNRDVGFPSAGKDRKPSFQRGHQESLDFGLEKEQRLKGTSPVHLHCPWSLVLISDSFCLCAKGETKKYSRMHGAWCVGLIAGDNYVTAGSQRVAQASKARLTILI
jgi:hypothetical protein